MIYSTLEANVRAKLNQPTATVSGVIDDAISLFNNFFSLAKIDTTKSTVNNQNYITKPTNSLEVNTLKIGTVYYHKMINEKSVEDAENLTLNKFIEKDDGKIYIFFQLQQPLRIVLYIIKADLHSWRVWRGRQQMCQISCCPY